MFRTSLTSRGRTLVRSTLAASLAGGLAAFALAPAVHAVAPTFYPAHAGESETAYTLRFAGASRFSTAGAAALLSSYNSKKTTGFPFNEPDPTAPTKAYGMGACPGTVLIAASDGLPDALAAASLRGVASTKLGSSTHAFNFANTILLLTDTARQATPPTGLNADTSATLALIKAQCPAFDAVILGGTAAVPASVETDLAKLVGTVGRVAGADRFATASQIASAVVAAQGLPKLTTYASASDKGTAQSGTVFLAEGLTGADALAAGPVAADKSVPILLTNTTSLPSATLAEITSLKPTTLVVLGGTGAISDAVVTAAKTAAGTSVAPIRIPGVNRADTSVQVAQTLDDLWGANASDPTGGGTGSFSNQLFGIARSEGSGAAHVGWPDALAASFVLDSVFSNGTAPTRLAPAIEANTKSPQATIGGKASAAKARPPLLLTGSATLAPEVDKFLQGLYPAPGPTASDDGGFAFVFGGTGAISNAAELTAALDVSPGQSYKPGAARTDLSPGLLQANVGYTGVDLTGYVTDATGGDGGLPPKSTVGDGPKVCLGRGAASGVQWLDALSGDGLGATQAVTYSTSAPEGSGSTPVCVAAGSTTKTGVVSGFSLSGNLSAPTTVDYSSDAKLLRTTTAGAAAGPNAAPTTGPTPLNNIYQPDTPAGNTTVDETWSVPLPVAYQGVAIGGPATLHLLLTRVSGGPGGTDGITCVGTINESAAGGSASFSAHLVGESATIPSNAPGSTNTKTIKCIGIYAIGAATGVWHVTLTSGGTNSGDMVSDLILDGNA